MSVVRLVDIEKNILYIQNIDVVDGTHLLDIKPYVPEYDDQKAEPIGWLSDKIYKMHEIKADERFK